jgi:hypothetical protein
MLDFVPLLTLLKDIVQQAILNRLQPNSAKREKFVTFALISTHGTTMVLHKEGVYRDGR